MRTFVAALALLVFVSNATLAGELEFPKTGETLFKLTVPDSWEVDSDDDDIVEAQSPKENVTLSIWAIDTEMTVEELAKDLKNILKDYATDVKLEEEPKQIDVDGLPGLFMVGRGQDKDDSHEVGFIALVVTKEDDAAIIFFEIDGNITNEELKKFTTIIESISAVK